MRIDEMAPKTVMTRMTSNGPTALKDRENHMVRESSHMVALTVHNGAELVQEERDVHTICCSPIFRTLECG